MIVQMSKRSKLLVTKIWMKLTICTSSDPSSRLGVFRMRLRGALEIEHMAIFFRANAFFQIKSDEEMTKPDSPDSQVLEKLETDGYEEAKKLRREILQEVSRGDHTVFCSFTCVLPLFFLLERSTDHS